MFFFKRTYTRDEICKLGEILKQWKELDAELDKKMAEATPEESAKLKDRISKTKRHFVETSKAIEQIIAEFENQ